MASVTLADVAAYAGVSTATVSMVLRNRGRISVETRQRVLRALDELGYVYNQTAANLRNRSSNQVGLLLPDISNPFYAEMTASLSREVERHQLMLFLANSEESVERQQGFVDSLLQNNAGGLVLCVARQTPDYFYDTLKLRKIPAIMVVRPIDDSYFDFVGTDNFLGTQLAVQHLIHANHQHIAFIGGSIDSNSRAQRLGGYMSKLVEHGINVNQQWIVPCDASQSAGAAAMWQLLHQYPQITAAVCYQDIVALGAMKALHQMNKTIGKEFALIGFDDITEASLVQPTLTTISVSAREIGRKAGELLDNRMQGDDSPPKRIILPPTLVVRESCGGSTNN